MHVRDHYQELRALGAEVFGLSTQITAYQAEMSSRLHLPFAQPVGSGFRLRHEEENSRRYFRWTNAEQRRRL
jgi:hypothetical protein